MATLSIAVQAASSYCRRGNAMPGTVHHLKDKLMRATDAEGNVSDFYPNSIHIKCIGGPRFNIFVSVT